MSLTVEPGKYSLTNLEYHSGPGISNSDLKLIRDGAAPIKYWAKKLSKEGIEETKTKAKQLGTDVHCALLEPDLFEQNYVIIPDDAPRRPTSRQWNAKNPSPDSVYAMEWWMEFNTENVLKTLITLADYQACQKIRDTVLSDPNVGPLFEQGEAEQSYYAIDEQTGLLIKCRPDWNTQHNVMIDLKKVVDCSKYGFGRAAGNYGYYDAAAHYLDIFGVLSGKTPEWFCFVAVEELFPHDIGFYYTTKEQLALGRRRNRAALDRVAEFTRANHWPKTCDSGIQPLWLPKYIMDGN